MQQSKDETADRLTRPFCETHEARLASDPAYAEAWAKEKQAMEGEPETARQMAAADRVLDEQRNVLKALADHDGKSETAREQRLETAPRIATADLTGERKLSTWH